MLTNKHLFLFLTPLCVLTLAFAVKYGMCSVKLNQNDFSVQWNESKQRKKTQKKQQNRAARIILDVSNDVNHRTGFCTLGSKPLSTERKTAREKMMLKILNTMGPQSITDLFPYKSEKTEYQTYRKASN